MKFSRKMEKSKNKLCGVDISKDDFFEIKKNKGQITLNEYYKIIFILKASRNVINLFKYKVLMRSSIICLLIKIY